MKIRVESKPTPCISGLVGIELLHLSRRTPKLDLRELLIQTA